MKNKKRVGVLVLFREGVTKDQVFSIFNELYQKNLADSGTVREYDPKTERLIAITESLTGEY